MKIKSTYKIKERVLALFLALLMAMSIMPVTAFADEGSGAATPPTLQQRVTDLPDADGVALMSREEQLALYDTLNELLEEMSMDAGLSADDAAAMEIKLFDLGLALEAALSAEQPDDDDDAPMDADTLRARVEELVSTPIVGVLSDADKQALMYKALELMNVADDLSDSGELSEAEANEIYEKLDGFINALFAPVPEDEEYTYVGQSLADINSVPEDVAGCAAEYNPPANGPAMLYAATETSFSAWYVGQKPGESTDVTKSADFMLKYQLNFSTKDDIPAGKMIVRIPYSLLNYRSDGKWPDKAVVPADISVPYGVGTGEGEFTPGRTTPLNYRLVTADGTPVAPGEDVDLSTVYMEFFNYKKILAGTALAWQVLFADRGVVDGVEQNLSLDVMEINDNTSWTLDTSIIVTDEDGNTVFSKAQDLKGKVDTGITLSAFTKEAFQNQLNYTPIMYTEGQISHYFDLNNMADGVERPLDFENYAYVLWKLKVAGNYGQYWDMYLDENPEITAIDADGNEHKLPGEVVAISRRNNLGGWSSWVAVKPVPETVPAPDPDDSTGGGSTAPQGKKYKIASYNTEFDYLKQIPYKGSLNAEFYVLTRYDREAMHTEVGNGVYNLNNDAIITLQSRDNPDDKGSGTAHDSRIWEEYRWKGDGGGSIIDITKSSNGHTIHEGGRYYGYFDYPAWKAVYLDAKAVDIDYGSLNFTVDSFYKGYLLTNKYTITDKDGNPTGGNGADAGVGDYNYIPGTYVATTTGDDVVIAWPAAQSGQPRATVLTEADYYYTSVKVALSDRQYDFFESILTKEATPTDTVGTELDRSATVYAMFSDEPGVWTKVTTIDWNESGSLGYTFSAAELARQPYRVKVEHNTVDAYDCRIYLTMTIRHDSPVFETFFDENGINADMVTVRNHCASIGVTQDGTMISGGSEDVYIRADNLGVDLRELSTELYGRDYITRSYGDANLKSVEQHAAASKNAGIKNNPISGQYDISYVVNAYESYPMSDPEAIGIMSELSTNVLKQRTSVEFYDLLPKDVQFNPSVPVVASRMTGLRENMRDSKEVTVTVNPDTDIIKNWHGTGRTMVVFHVEYAGADPSVTYYDPNYADPYYHWMTGYEIRFGAYTLWEDTDVSLEESNIAAYMPVKTDTYPLIGTVNEVMCDDGVINGNYAGDKAYDPFRGAGDYAGVTEVGDINGDGVTDIRNVLYARVARTDDFAKAVKIGITKTVSTSEKTFDTNREEATVRTGGEYTYHLTVTNLNDETSKLTGLVIYDHIEAAIDDRGTNPREPLQADMFGKDPWKGEFLGIDVSSAAELGVAPIVYYNSSDDAKLPEDGTEATAKAFLADPSNGWTTEKPAVVKWIAVDLTKMKNGKDFEIYEGSEDANGNKPISAVSIDVRMKAPEDWEENAGKTNLHTYNNPAFTGFVMDTQSTEEGNAIRLTITNKGDFVVEKEFLEGYDVPDPSREFAFTINKDVTTVDSSTGLPVTETQIAPLEKYTLQEQVNGVWTDVDTLGTGADAILKLKAGQRAVFKGPDAYCMSAVEEDLGVAWKQHTSDIKDDDNKKIGVCYTNEYTPLLYLSKKTDGVPASVNLEDESFGFRVMKNTGTKENPNWMPVTEPVTYYLVEAVPVGSNSPKVIGEAKTTGTDGILHIKSGEIAALELGHIGDMYKIEEGETVGDAWVVASAEADSEWLNNSANAWIPQFSPAVKDGTLAASGNKAEFTNYYRYKELNLTKQLENWTSDTPCNQVFTFHIAEIELDDAGEMVKDTDGNVKEKPVGGLNWKLVNPDGSDALNASGAPISGTTDTDGKFSAACAGKTIVLSSAKTSSGIIGLDLFKVYRVTEDSTGSSDFVEKGDVSSEAITFTKKQTSNNITVTNNYLKRDLAVTKQLVSLNPDSSAVFTMKLTKLVSGSEMAVTDHYFILKDKSGTETPSATNEFGNFTLKDGQTAYFKEVGLEGETFYVTEESSGAYQQLFPANNKPLEFVLPAEGAAEKTLINGDPGLMVVSKQWNADDDTAKQWLAENNARTSLADKADLGISFNVEIDPAGGSDYRAPAADDNMKYIVIHGGGATTGTTSGMGAASDVSGAALSIEDPENDAIVLFMQGEGGSLVSGWSYRIKEASLSAAEPENPKTAAIIDTIGTDTAKTTVTVRLDSGSVAETEFEGTLADAPSVQITNHISAWPDTWIYKYMAGNETPVDGAKLIWRVERREAGRWTPASGVDYIISYDRQFAEDDMVYTTDATGLITLTADSMAGADPNIPAGTKPYSVAVGFRQQVAVNVESASEGDLRVVEVLEGTDASWGRLLAYCDANGSYETFSNPENPAGFVNSSNIRYIRVEKQMKNPVVSDDPDEEVPPEGPFRFILTQNMNGEDIPGSNVPYVIKNSADDSVVSDTNTTTGADGSFTLMAGQYAEIAVLENTVWEVSEETQYPYRLVDVETTNADTDGADATFDLRAVLKPGKEINSLMKKGAAYTSGDADIGHVYFGTKTEYASALTDIVYYTEADKAENGSIMLYRLGNGDVYILADNAPIVADKDCSDMFNNLPGLQSVSFNGKLDTSRTTDMSEMFSGCTILPAADISTLKTNSVTNMRAMFSGCEAAAITLGDNFNTANVTDMSSMFENCKSISSVPLDKFSTAKVTDMSNMFKGCSSLTEMTIPATMDTSAVRNMSGMFDGCSGLTTLNVANLKTQNVTDMSRMFKDCSGVIKLDVTALNTAKVTDMSEMFSGCSSVQMLETDRFSVVKVTKFDRMFKDCSSLETIYCRNDWPDDSESSIVTASGMFSGCTKLVGGGGTFYADGNDGFAYAQPDGGNEDPGYFRGPAIDLAQFTSNMGSNYIRNMHQIQGSYTDGNGVKHDIINGYYFEHQAFGGHERITVPITNLLPGHTYRITYDWQTNCTRWYDANQNHCHLSGVATEKAKIDRYKEGTGTCGNRSGELGTYYQVEMPNDTNVYTYSYKFTVGDSGEALFGANICRVYDGSGWWSFWLTNIYVSDITP